LLRQLRRFCRIGGNQNHMAARQGA
jgi:hypothetical protein